MEAIIVLQRWFAVFDGTMSLSRLGSIATRQHSPASPPAAVAHDRKLKPDETIS
jgi:hypothetical protein